MFTKPLPVVGFSLFQLAIFIITLIVGIIIVRVISRLLRKTLEKAGAPPLVVGLLDSIIRVIGYVIVLLAALPAIGISTGTVTLGLSAVIGLILGFGLQDTWTNMAAGVWLAVSGPSTRETLWRWQDTRGS